MSRFTTVFIYLLVSSAFLAEFAVNAHTRHTKNSGTLHALLKEAAKADHKETYSTIEDGDYIIRSKLDNLVLDVQGGSKEAVAPVIQWPYHGNANQVWNFRRLSNGAYIITSKNSGQVLDITGQSKANGAKLIQYPSWNGPNQQWQLTLNSDATYYLTALHSGQVLDISGSSTQQGLQIQQWPNNGGHDNQRFYLQRVNDLNLVNVWYNIRCKHDNLVLDVQGGSKDNTAPVIQWPRHGGANQQWHFQHLSGNVYKIINRNSGLVLDITGQSKEAGAKLIQYQWWNGPNQQWKVSLNSDGSYYLTAVHSGQVLDISGSSTQQGVQVQQWPNNGGHPNQRFLLDKQ